MHSLYPLSLLQYIISYNYIFCKQLIGMYLSEHEIVDYILSIDNDLKDAYELLNEYRNFNSVATIDNAAEMLDELIIKFHNSIINEYHKSYKLLKNWRQEIIN